MIDKKKVRRMARMEAYEAQDGKSDSRIVAYFKGDYLTRQILITFFSTTMAFLILAAMYVVYNFETLIVEIYSMDIRAVGMQILIIYLIFVGSMMIITLAVYESRYRRAKKHISAYYHDLSKLSEQYSREEKGM